MNRREQANRLAQEPAVQYLLNLPGCDREALEARLFADDAFAQELQAAEHELLDAYVRNELTNDMRRRVESDLLSDAEQHTKLAVARALAARHVERRRWRTPAWLAVAACLLLAIAVGFLRERDRPAGTANKAPAMTTRARNTVALLLTPGVLRGPSIPNLRIPAGVESVRLELADADVTGSVAVTFFDEGGKAVWRDEHAEAQTEGVVVSVPASSLRRGLYRVSLSGGSHRAYFFRVN